MPKQSWSKTHLLSTNFSYSHQTFPPSLFHPLSPTQGFLLFSPQSSPQTTTNPPTKPSLTVEPTHEHHHYRTHERQHPSHLRLCFHAHRHLSTLITQPPSTFLPPSTTTTTTVIAQSPNHLSPRSMVITPLDLGFEIVEVSSLIPFPFVISEFFPLSN